MWERICKISSDDPDREYVLLDATHIRVHQHGTGAKGGLAIRPRQVARRLDHEDCSARDALGNLVRFVPLPGQRHDVTSFDVLMAGIACLAFIGDKAFDANGYESIWPAKASRL